MADFLHHTSQPSEEQQFEEDPDLEDANELSEPEDEKHESRNRLIDLKEQIAEITTCLMRL